MATMVGTQKELGKLLHALIELDLDAISAYRAAVDKLEDQSDKAQLASFMADHERHVRELSPILERLGHKPPQTADIKAVLTKGKVVIAGLFGDRAILIAMKTNEDDTNKAYERATERNDLPADLREVLMRGLSDERRHRAYIEGRIHAAAQAPAHR